MISKPLHTNTPIAPAQPPVTVDVWIVDLNQPESFIRATKEFLATDELACAQKFTNTAARRNYLVSHYALRHLLATRLGLAPKSIAFRLGLHGKPALADTLQGRLHFNLSHSGTVGLIAICESVEVGVDVEHIRPMADASRLAKRFFTAAESAALDRIPEAERQVHFFRMWTRKEALLKATGLGIAHGLSRFEVAATGDGGLIAVDGNEAAAKEWSLHSWSPIEGYLAAAAVPRPAMCVSLNRFSCEQLAS